MRKKRPPPRPAPDEGQPWPFSPSDRHGWPDPDDYDPNNELHKALLETKLAVRQKRAEQAIAMANAETALDAQYYAAILEVAKGAIDRTRGGAELVQKSAAAIVTLYTGVLALSFSVAERPLPFRALFAVFLLGLAVVLATAFIAYLPDPEDVTRPRDPNDRMKIPADRRVARFIRWTRDAALQKRKWLRASVVALGAALFFLPAPFVVIGEQETPQVVQRDWPRTPTTVTNVELQKIVYTAQVEEVAEERKKPLADEEGWGDYFWWAAFGVALFLVIVLPQLSGKGARPFFEQMNPFAVPADRGSRR